MNETRLERKGNVVDIYKPEGIYTLLYGRHDQATDVKLLPPKFDGLILETGVYRWSEDPLYCLNKDLKNRQYSRLIKKLEDDGSVPIYLADYVINFGTVSAEAVLSMMSVTIGLLCILNSSMHDADIKEGVLGLWLGLPLITYLGRGFSLFTGLGENITTSLNKLIHKIRPDDMLFTLQLRNTILAHKKQFIIEQINTVSKSNKQPQLVTIIGAGHSGIEDEIQKSQAKRLRFLKTIKPAIKMTTGSLDSFYKICRLDFDGNNWGVGDIYEVPELKTLINS